MIELRSAMFGPACSLDVFVHLFRFTVVDEADAVARYYFKFMSK